MQEFIGTDIVGNILRNAYLIIIVSFCLMWFSALIGVLIHKRKVERDENARHDLDLIVSATLTLLGLIIGFSFSMAISRYDQRKGFEEAEANAIGTEYVRAELLPSADAAKVQALLKGYLDQRIEYYESTDTKVLASLDAAILQRQTDLWRAIKTPAEASPNPVMALVVSGMNDVLNSQGYTQAAWWNRVPPGAWYLMMMIALAANVLVGYAMRQDRLVSVRLLVLPVVLSVAFFAIADIDSPRRGIITVHPQNLISLKQTL